FRVKINPLDKLHQKRLEDILKVNDVNNLQELKSSNLSIASHVKTILDVASMDNFHLKIHELRNLFENSNLEDDEKKMTIDELNDFSNQLTQYKKQNIKPSLEGFKSALALGLMNNSSNRETGIC